MKQLQGKANNIKEDILGVITFGKNIFGRSNCVLVDANATKSAIGYMATITEHEDFNDSGKPFCIVNDTSTFNEGDVVVMNKNGDIVFVYEIESKHNALLATELCNHRCIMCPQPPILKEHDRTPFNLKLISLLDKNTEEVGITGGEPTMIGDNLFVLINHIKKVLPKSGISILSNGVKFANKEYAMKLAMCRHHDLQIDIPLFSDIAEEHNRIVGAKTFYKTVQGLYNLALFHQRIGLRIVVHKQTYKRLPQFADFVYHNFPFVSQVAFMQMETTGLAKENFDKLWIDPYNYNKELREAVTLLADRGMSPYIYNSQLCILPEDIRQYAMQSISDWKDIYLPECEGCVLRGQCAGFFESNRQTHSAHIHKIIDYTPQPLPRNIEDIEGNVSPFLKNKFQIIKDLIPTDGIVIDAPSGYGRNALWIAKKGYDVRCYDMDSTANMRLTSFAKQNGINIKVIEQNILDINHNISCDFLMNIHLYSIPLLNRMTAMLKPKGILLIETPELRGGNYLELPKIGELRKRLKEDFDILIYTESSNKENHCSVKLIAQKK